ncbi:MAG: hypothetical protein Q8R18_06615 [bacterium]|nr:hypothetical protein [bacterium]
MAEKDERERSQKNTLLDTSVLIEGKRGMTSIFSIIEFPIAINDCIVLYPEALDFELAVRIAGELRKKGKPIGGIDTIIASMSINRGYTLVTRDSHFSIIKEIIPDFHLKLV